MAQIQFKGKSFVQNHHLLVKYHELIPKKDKSLTDKVSLHDNLIIHGDNLKALKALLPLYAGKIKCIYILNVKRNPSKTPASRIKQGVY